MERITRAGLPAAIQLAGIDLVTTLAAAMTELSPIVTPLRTIARLPSQTLFPILIGAFFPLPEWRVVGLISWKSLSNMLTWSPTRQWLPISIARVAMMLTLAPKQLQLPIRIEDSFPRLCRKRRPLPSLGEPLKPNVLQLPTCKAPLPTFKTCILKSTFDPNENSRC
jgi:hypothetical protein